MPSLPELQRRFADAIAGDSTPAAPGFEVYRRSIEANYRRALAATYPVVRALVGAPFFDAAVDAFAAAHPSISGDLNVYGDAFAPFVARHAPASTLPYLPDVARLEWALDESARAADVESDPQALIAAISVIEDDAIGNMHLTLHPSCRRVASSFPVFEIWTAHQPGQDPGMQVDASAGATGHVLVRRSAHAPLVERITAAESAWLGALAGGADFSWALGQALQVDPEFDLGQALQSRVMDGTVSSLAS
jgi:hypothetical protein